MAITVEELMSQLENQVKKLTEELEQAQKDIRDFEVLAIEWKKGHSDLKIACGRKIMEKDQIIEELKEELLDFRANREY